jgi:hypothetical protein
MEDEDRDYQTALEESRRMYEQDQVDRHRSQEQLQRALEKSKLEESTSRGRGSDPTVDLFSQVRHRLGRPRGP